MKHGYFIIALLVIVGIFFREVFLYNKLPVPADTIVGLYHPFRDLYVKTYPNGIPFKNSLITDPVRQQYPWKILTITLEKKFELPLWNPYAFGGYPLLGNFQSAPFYPLNIVFFLLPFNLAWTILVYLQLILSGFFLYLYLNYLKINKFASFLSSVSFVFSGFSIAWLEWNTVVQTALWLPLVLLAKEHLIRKKSTQWVIVLIFAETCAIFAGHLQIYFYLFLISNIYLIGRIVQISAKKYSGRYLAMVSLRNYLPFIFLGLAIFFITAIQTIPTARFIFLSARDIDQRVWQSEGWFIPWQHLIQFVVPDFFGNPTTLNYWGVWNYGELIGYIGIIPTIFALFAVFFRQDRKTLFYGSIFFLSLIFSLPTFIAKIPFVLHIPFFSTAQPTRLLFLTDFSLAILAGLGLDFFIKTKHKIKIFYPLGFFALLIGGLWIFVLGAKDFAILSGENVIVAKRNLYFPTFIIGVAFSLFVLLSIVSKKTVLLLLYSSILVITVFDALRFSEKFTPFTSGEYLFPNTKAISFLQRNIGHNRIMTVDSRILPPNFSIMYRLQSIDGYDPLYLQRYGEFIAASERGKPDISPPFGFNRIITPRNYSSRLIDLMGVKYILSLSDISSPKLKKVFQEGQTRVYENTDVLPRAFFVQSGGRVITKEQAMEALFEKQFDPQYKVIVEDPMTFHFDKMYVGQANITQYSENHVVIETNNQGDGFLVLTDSFYPTWKAKIDKSQVKIYRADYNFRGVFVSKGNHIVEFDNALL